MPKLSWTVAEPTALKTPTLSMNAWKPRLLELTDNLALQSFNEGHFLCEKKYNCLKSKPQKAIDNVWKWTKRTSQTKLHHKGWHIQVSQTWKAIKMKVNNLHRDLLIRVSSIPYVKDKEHVGSSLNQPGDLVLSGCPLTLIIIIEPASSHQLKS